jgi:hypothetical protein
VDETLASEKQAADEERNLPHLHAPGVHSRFHRFGGYHGVAPPRCTCPRSAAREGEHAVQFARIVVNSIPTAPIRSMFGVRTSEAPYAETSP